MTETLRTPEERLLIMNTTLGTGDVQLSEGFLAWRKWVGENPDLGAGRLLHLTCPQPFEIAEAGHFVQEWGEDVAIKALAAFQLS